MGFALLFVLAEGKSLWTTQDPSTAGLVVALLLVTAGVAGVVLLLKRSEPEPLDSAMDPVDRELRAIRNARAQLQRELDGARPALRAALGPLLDGPLGDYDGRVNALVASARAQRGASPPAHLALERERLRVDLEAERDPRARVLLEASLRDVESAEQVQADLARNGRLSLLELRRMKTLLASLPGRVKELASRQDLRGEVGDVEAIARQLEIAVQDTGEVLGTVVPATSETH